MTTVGATHALDLVARTLLQPGDAVVVDEPGWAVEYARLSRLGMRLLPVPRGPEGPDLAVLAALLREHRPRLYVTVSVLHNPTGTSLTPAAAHQVLRLAEAHDLTIVEDDTYSWLAPLHATRLAQLDALQRTVYVSGFSKILTPQWRVGFLAAAPALAERLIDSKLLSTLTTPGPLERAVAICLDQGALRRHAERVASLLHGARQRTVRLVRDSGCQFRAEPAGLFGWSRRGRGYRAPGPAPAGRRLAHRTRFAVPRHAAADIVDARQLRDRAGRALLAAAAPAAYIRTHLKRQGGPAQRPHDVQSRLGPAHPRPRIPTMFPTTQHASEIDLLRISEFQRRQIESARAEDTGAGSTRLSSLNPSLLQDLLRFDEPARAGVGLELIEVMAAAVRHGRALLLQVEHELHVFALTVFPVQRQVHAPLNQEQLLALPLHQLRVLHVEPSRLHPEDEPESMSPLGMLLWELALRGSRDELLPEIGGPAAYRIAPGWIWNGWNSPDRWPPPSRGCGCRPAMCARWLSGQASTVNGPCACSTRCTCRPG